MFGISCGVIKHGWEIAGLNGLVWKSETFRWEKHRTKWRNGICMADYQGLMRIHWGYNGIIQTFFIMGTIWQYTNNLIWVCQWGFSTFMAGFKGNDYWPCEFWGIFHIIAIPKSVSSELSSFNTNMITLADPGAGAPCFRSVKVTIARTLYTL